MYAAENISIRVGAKTILDSASLSLTPGKVVAIVGPNGAGKSTLMKVMAGERRYDSGSVTLDGASPVAMGCGGRLRGSEQYCRSPWWSLFRFLRRRLSRWACRNIFRAGKARPRGTGADRSRHAARARAGL